MKVFTKEELIFVKDNYTEMNYSDIGIRLNKNERQIINLCFRKKWRKKVPNWTSEEIKLLINYYNVNKTVNMGTLEEMFPNRDRSNINRKARELNLTDKHRPLRKELIKEMSIRMKEWISINGHPKGSLGYKHSEATKLKFSKISKQRWADPNYILNSDIHKQKKSDRMSRMQTMGILRNRYSRAKIGKRKDLNNLFVRSSWEANYARYLNYLMSINKLLRWEYESDTYYFEEIKRGVRSYTPDFKIFNNDGTIEYHEVKGWMDCKSKTKLKRMAKYYPEIRIVLICAKEYCNIKNYFSKIIPYWE